MRLIDADKFDEKYIEIKVGSGFAEDEEISAKDVVYFQALALDALPTIDAVEIVRCKDCISSYVSSTGYLMCDGEKVKEDFFCASGARKQ